jgi:hypothetical protein
MTGQLFSLKAFYNREYVTFMAEHKYKNISMCNILELSGKACPKAVTPENIISGFRCTSISLSISRFSKVRSSSVPTSLIDHQLRIPVPWNLHHPLFLLLMMMRLISPPTMRMIPNLSQDSFYTDKLKKCL